VDAIKSDTAAILALSAELGWPLLADAPSGCRVEADQVVSTADALLRHSPFAEQHRPEVVLRLGGLVENAGAEGPQRRLGPRRAGQVVAADHEGELHVHDAPVRAVVQGQRPPAHGLVGKLARFFGLDGMDLLELAEALAHYFAPLEREDVLFLLADHWARCEEEDEEDPEASDE